MFTARPFDRTRIRIESIANQKKVRTGSRMMYSIMKNSAAKSLTRKAFSYWLYWFRFRSIRFFFARNR